MIKFIKIFFLTLFILLSSCMDSYDNKELFLKNNSKKIVYCLVSENNNINGSKTYDEYTKNEKSLTEKDRIFMFRFQEIGINEKLETERPKFWKNYFDGIKDKKMRLFIVSKNDVEKFGWSDIIKKQIYIKKYELTLQDLEDKKWEIVFE